MTEQEVYRSDTLLVRAIPAADRARWVVTFDHFDSGTGWDRPGFAQAFFAERGVSVVTFVAAGNHWFQYADMAAALAAARAAIPDGARVLTYGSSMGGYAAIRFADRLGAFACLAISPQYSNDPAKTPFEWRWPNEATSVRWLAEVDGPIRCAFRPVVVADPHREDGAHVRLIAADTPIDFVPLPYTAHPVGTYLNAEGLLEPALFALLDGTFDVAAFAGAARARRKGNAVYLGELARVQPAWRPRLGVALARLAVSREPDNPLAVHMLATKLSETNDHMEARMHHERVMEMTGRAWGYALAYSNALVAAGDLDAAMAVSRELVDRHPDMAQPHMSLALVLSSRGADGEALAEAEAAHDLVPGEQYRRIVRRLRSRLWRRRWTMLLRAVTRRARPRRPLPRGT